MSRTATQLLKYLAAPEQTPKPCTKNPLRVLTIEKNALLGCEKVKNRHCKSAFL